ncbi:MAG TPA: CBS domain-containing protein [Gemmatimonadaceae bacterium]|nr:CBS domain-containing protein [Gemmatimonadaceae bacterium]
MPAVRDVLRRKGTVIVALAPSASVLDAAQVMTDRSIGALLVMDDGRLLGIFTERDVLRRVVATGRDPASTPLGEVMTANVLTCTPATALDECREVMTARRLRHLPVIGPDGLCGIISSGDVLAFQVSEQEGTIQDLSRFVYDVR